MHHAHEAYLVPDVLKRAYGAIRIACVRLEQNLDHVTQGIPLQSPSLRPMRGMLSFRSLGRLPSRMTDVQSYKREAYRGSEFAARILSENGLKVVVKVGNCPSHHAASRIYEYYSPIIRCSIPDTSCMRRNKYITTAFLLTWHLPPLQPFLLMSLDWSIVLGT